MDFKETASNNSLKNSKKRKYFLSPCNMKYFRLFYSSFSSYWISRSEIALWTSLLTQLWSKLIYPSSHQHSICVTSKGSNGYKIKMGAMHLSALHPLMRRSDLAHWESLSFVVVIVKAEVAHVKSSQILCLLDLNKVLTGLSTTACSMSVNTVE